MQRSDAQSPFFDPTTHVGKICSETATAEDLRQAKTQVHALGDENNTALKAAVYKHHARYIDIAKDVAKLESGVTELSGLLQAESYCISDMLTVLRSGVIPGSQTSEDRGYTLSDVQGLDKSDPLVAGTIQAQGQFQLVQLQRRQLDATVQVFLLKSSLVISRVETAGITLHPNLCLLSVEALADAEVKDTGEGSDQQRSFTVRARESYTFLAASGFDKRKWIRRLQRAIDTLKGTAAREVPSVSSAHAHGSLAEAWLLEAPEDLESAIAQRDFRNAVDCYSRALLAIQADTTGDPAITSVRRKLDGLHTRLSHALCHELDRPGLRSADICQTVQLLLDLQEREKARHKYFTHWSKTLQKEFRNLKVEGSTELFVRKLSAKFFTILKTTCYEFHSLFDDHESNSAYIAWVDEEMSHFCSVFRRQVFDTATNSFGTVAECVSHVGKQGELLKGVGLSIGFLFWALIEDDCKEAINEAGRKWINATAHQLVEEPWDRVVFGGRNARKDFVTDLSMAGVEHPEDVLEGMATILFRATVHFALDSHEFAAGAALLFTDATAETIVSWFDKLYLLFIKKLTQEFSGSETFKSNAQFVIDVCFAHAIQLIEEAHGGRVSELRDLRSRVARTWEAAVNEEGISHI